MADRIWSTLVSRLERHLLSRRLSGDLQPVAEQRSVALLRTDLTGFTALADRLSSRGNAGIEELASVLESELRPVVDSILDTGGDLCAVAGDALVAIWQADESRPVDRATWHAVHCANAVTQLQKHSSIPASRLSLRAAVGAGAISVFELGGADGRWTSFLCGDALTQAIAADRFAAASDVVLSPQAARLVQHCCVTTSRGADAELLRRVDSPPRHDIRVDEGRLIASDAIRARFPAEIAARVELPRSDWFGELRTVTVMFVRLARLTETALHDVDRLHAMVQSIQTNASERGGVVHEVSSDDKGVVAVVAFGLPGDSGADHDARAVETALALRRTSMSAAPFAIGIAKGTVFCGMVGTSRRQQYSIVGLPMNRAARLMAVANDNQVLLDQPTSRGARLPRFSLSRLTGRALKGIGGQSAVFAVSTDVQDAAAIVGSDGRLIIGRAMELAAMEHAWASLASGHAGRVIVLEGESGVGKSLLVREFAAKVRADGGRVVETDVVTSERLGAYNPWRPVFAALLSVNGIRLHGGGSTDAVTARLVADPLVGPLAPLLTPVLPFAIADSPLTAAMTDEVRADHLRTLLLGLIQRRARAEPLVVIIEDAQRFDSASSSLLQHILSRAERVLVVITRTPGAGAVTLASIPAQRVETYTCGLLGEGETELLMRDRLAVENIPSGLLDLVRRRTSGNPFFAEQLTLALVDAGAIERRGSRCTLTPADQSPDRVLDTVFRERGVPSPLASLVTRRLDRLSLSQQMVLRVASVLGGRFTAEDLGAVTSSAAGSPAGRPALRELTLQGFLLDDEPEKGGYRFRHELTRNVVYESIPIAGRTQLHAAALSLFERKYEHHTGRHLPELAHHARLGGAPEKAYDYALSAGMLALREYASKEAIGHLTDAREHLKERSAAERSDAQRVNAALARVDALLGRAYLNLSMYDAQRLHLERSLALLGVPVPRTTGGVVFWSAIETAGQAVRRVAHIGHAAPRVRAVVDDRSAAAATALEGLAENYYYGSDQLRAFYACVRGLNLAERSGVPSQFARSLATFGGILGLVPLHGVSETYGRWSIQIVRSLNDEEALTWVLLLTGIVRAGRGNWLSARLLFEEVRDLSERTGAFRRWADAVGHLAMIDWLQGDWSGALAQTQRLVERASDEDDTRYYAEALRSHAHILVERGALDEASRALVDLDGCLRRGISMVEEVTRRDTLAIRAKLLLRLGEEQEALTCAGSALTLLERAATADDLYLGFLVPAAIAEVAITLVRRNHLVAPRLAGSAAAILKKQARVLPIVAARAALYRGLVHVCEGRLSRALYSWRDGEDAAIRFAMPFDLLLLRAEIARYTTASDARSRGLADVESGFASLGAPWHESIARALAQAAPPAQLLPLGGRHE